MYRHSTRHCVLPTQELRTSTRNRATKSWGSPRCVRAFWDPLPQKADYQRVMTDFRARQHGPRLAQAVS